MGLITLGINIGFSIILIPVGFLVLIAAAIFSGALGFAIGGLMSLISAGALPIVVGLVVGLPTFITLMAIPLGFLDGLREVFMSSTWTLTYREARTLENLQLDQLTADLDTDDTI